MINPFKLAAQFILVAALFAAVAVFSNWPAYRTIPQGHAVIMLSFVHGANRQAECRRLSPAEIAKLPPNMRRVQDCPRGRRPIYVELDLGSETDSGDYRMTLDRCLADFDWAEKSKLQGKLIEGRRHGIAVGCYLEGGGSGPRENVRMVLENDGSVSLYVGSSSVGQGVETVFAQIAADALDMPMARINRVQHGSTIYLKQGYGSYSSRSIVMGGMIAVVILALLMVPVFFVTVQRVLAGDREPKVAEEAASELHGPPAPVRPSH